MRCENIQSGIACRDVESGHGFSISREAYQLFSLSPSAFSRTFREVTGRAPYQYVKEARLDRARRLLDEGRLGVADVSRSVGYTSVSHFIKGFRRRFGVTPGDYADAHMLRLRVGRCLDCGATATPCDVAS